MMVSLTSGSRRLAAFIVTTIGHGVIDSSYEKFFYRIGAGHRTHPARTTTIDQAAESSSKAGHRAALAAS
jgi:hypothetical protein